MYREEPVARGRSESLRGPDKMDDGHQNWTCGLFVMAVLCLSLSTEDSTEECVPGLTVRRFTSYNVSVGQQLKIACPVTFCEGVPPTITWFKCYSESCSTTPLNTSGRFKTEWETTTGSEGVSYFIIEKVLSSDMAQYHCKSEHSVSHIITINVNVKSLNSTMEDNTTLQDRKNTTADGTHDQTRVEIYLLTAAGIVGLVIMLIVISVFSMRGCKGKAKDNCRSANQYMDLPMIEQRTHHSSNQALPRASPCGTPSHWTSRKTKSPSAPTQRDSVDRQVEGQWGSPGEQGGSVVYAALNHQHLVASSPRPRTVVDEKSEYAAIRVS